MSCIMKDCPNSRHACKRLNFFKLPHTDEKRKQWLDICKSQCALPKFPVVCADHFLPSQMYIKGQRVRLHADAVPMPLHIVNAKRSGQGKIPKLESRQKLNKVQQKKLEKFLPKFELEDPDDDYKLDVREKKFKKGLTEFELEPDDDYDVRCGEVFLTYSGVLVFHCSPCNKKYGSIIHFLKHLSIEHYKHIREDLVYEEYDSSSENIKKSTSMDNITCEEEIEIKLEDEYDDMQEFMKIEIQPTTVQTPFPQDPFREIEQILIEETSHCKDTDIEYEDLNGEEKTVEGFYALDSKNKFEDEKQSLSEAEKPEKTKRKDRPYQIYKCEICNKIFKSLMILKRHATVHSSERKYKCELCGVGLKHYSYMKRHMLRHTGEKNISCEICSKKFYTNSEHKLHLRSHTGEKPFVCSSCGLAFTNSGALTVHEKIHNIEPLFRCKYCNKGFYSEYKMKGHMVVHTKERPFICSICSATFPRKRSMLRHIELRHKKPSCTS